VLDLVALGHSDRVGQQVVVLEPLLLLIWVNFQQESFSAKEEPLPSIGGRLSVRTRSENLAWTRCFPSDSSRMARPCWAATKWAPQLSIAASLELTRMRGHLSIGDGKSLPRSPHAENATALPAGVSRGSG
jgi:hypothetical protein